MWQISATGFEIIKKLELGFINSSIKINLAPLAYVLTTSAHLGSSGY